MLTPKCPEFASIYCMQKSHRICANDESGGSNISTALTVPFARGRITRAELFINKLRIFWSNVEVEDRTALKKSKSEQRKACSVR